MLTAEREQRFGGCLLAGSNSDTNVLRPRWVPSFLPRHEPQSECGTCCEAPEWQKWCIRIALDRFRSAITPQKIKEPKKSSLWKPFPPSSRAGWRLWDLALEETGKRKGGVLGTRMWMKG